MFAKFILILHKLQYPIPSFFTFGLWIVMLFSFLMGNSTIGWYLFYFLMLKIFVQLSFIYIVAKKMASQGNSEELKKYTAHTRMKLSENGMAGGMAGFQEMMQKQAEEMQRRANQNHNRGANHQNIDTVRNEDDYIEYEEIEEEENYKGLEVGDVIKINDGTYDPDFPALNLSGFHARVKKLYQEDGVSLVVFAWDSLSIEAIPLKYFRMAKEQNLDFFEVSLEISELTKATARDTLEDVEKMKNKMMHLLNDND